VEEVGHKCDRCVLPLEEICYHGTCLREPDIKRIAELEAAIDKAIKHADGNGMKDWPVFRTLRKVMKSK